MVHRDLFRTLIGISILFFIFVPARAQWVEDGTVLASRPTSQQYVIAVPDGQGGAVAAWIDFTGAGPDIYAQRVDGAGRVLWGTSGTVVCAAAGDQWLGSIIPDGAGGAILVWDDYRASPTDADAYAQRIDAGGSVLWASDGVVVSAAPGIRQATMVADGAGGAIIAWGDLRGGVDLDLYAQRVDANGDTVWAGDGVAISTQTGDESSYRLVSDGVGGAVILWADRRNGVDWDVYGQRVDAGGNALWTPGGRAVITFAGNQVPMQAVTDGRQGAIVVWYDTRSGPTWDLYAQRLSDEGFRFWDWTGVPICLAPGHQGSAAMVADGSGGGFLAWEDERGSYIDIYAQHLGNDGSASWTPDGVPIRTGLSDDAESPDIGLDGMGGAIVVWEDIRFSDGDLYAQRVDPTGADQWPLNGVPFSTAVDGQTSPRLVPGSPGSVIVTWYDFRDRPGSDVYVQRLEAHFGNWGDVAGQIAAIADIPADQGGQVDLGWDASRLDVFGAQTVTHYSVWRDVPAAVATAPGFRPRRVDPSQVGKGFRGPAVRVEKTAAGTYYWEWVGNADAQYFEGYAMTVSTVNDSMAASSGTHYFQVLTHTADRLVFWPSAPDSGHSVDNLAPAAPQGVAGDYDDTSGTMTLSWHPNPEPDLARYDVYRDVGPEFVPSDLNRITTTTDTLLTGLLYIPDPQWYFKFSAVDIHGNESDPATLAPGDITTPALVSSYRSGWSNGRVVVAWTLADVTGSLDVEVYRKPVASGRYRLLDVVVDRTREEFRFEDPSAAPGNSYRYRVVILEEGAAVASFEVTAAVPAARLALHQNHPNPFFPETVIGFELAEEGPVELSLYDVSGRRVATLLSGRRSAGFHEVPFRANGLAAGVYFYKLTVGATTLVRKAVLLR